MLAGFTPWPAADVARWKAAGHRPGRRVGDIVADAAARLPDKTAVIDADRRLSYAELLQRADQLARRLQDSGLEREDRVVMQLPNSIEFVLAFLALMRLGAIAGDGLAGAPVQRDPALRARHRAPWPTWAPACCSSSTHRRLAQDVQRDCPGLLTTSSCSTTRCPASMPCAP
jgi:2,3-dihydroxybenzoate-AMP ligase